MLVELMRDMIRHPVCLSGVTSKVVYSRVRQVTDEGHLRRVRVDFVLERIAYERCVDIDEKPEFEFSDRRYVTARHAGVNELLAGPGSRPLNRKRHLVTDRVKKPFQWNCSSKTPCVKKTTGGLREW